MRITANISTYALQTAIDPALEALGVQMAYRLAQLINPILQNTADGANADRPLRPSFAAGHATAHQPPTSPPQCNRCKASMPCPSRMGATSASFHPLIVGNVLVDQNHNSLTDVLKRTAQGNERLKELPAPDGDAVTVLDWGGATFFQSTLRHTDP